MAVRLRLTSASQARPLAVVLTWLVGSSLRSVGRLPLSPGSPEVRRAASSCSLRLLASASLLMASCLCLSLSPSPSLPSSRSDLLSLLLSLCLNESIISKKCQ